ncbi:TPA: antitoxin Xre/MbcA/ParS toxin-binding domain-containing protein [Pseudomonas aeruginosa]|uniref:antitoxin Xre/MbcA/ParS toxin-binding domain-containing protein n=1 Tax=Pseudomonas aeruginosa TaxID=287 RepID=UPI00053D3FC1|nr:antitoxin Xre/MbcA/ParS toxin-binding domain-containing protein [Pseudomonas aeruginosa]
MGMLHEKLGLPKGHYYLHVAVLAGLPASLVSDLASELEQSPAQVAEWVTASPGSAVMSMQASEVFCRLIEILDALLELYDGDLGGALHWLTAPNMVLSNERPVELLATESGARAVRQAIRAIEYGLPV